MNEEINNSNQNTKVSFWNFKEKKVYTKFSQKLGDLIFGSVLFYLYLCIVWFFMLVVNIFFWYRSGDSYYLMSENPIDFWVASFLLVFFVACLIYFLIYIFKRRRYIFYGTFVNSILFFLFVMATFNITYPNYDSF